MLLVDQPSRGSGWLLCRAMNVKTHRSSSRVTHSFLNVQSIGDKAKDAAGSAKDAVKVRIVSSLLP